MTTTFLTRPLFTSASALLHASLDFLGLDAFIERTGPEWAFLGFDHVNHGEGQHEAWGLGLHVVVSPLPAARPRA